MDYTHQNWPKLWLSSEKKEISSNIELFYEHGIYLLLVAVGEQYKDLKLLLNIMHTKTIGLTKFSCLLTNI